MSAVPEVNDDSTEAVTARLAFHRAVETEDSRPAKIAALNAESRRIKIQRQRGAYGVDASLMLGEADWDCTIWYNAAPYVEVVSVELRRYCSNGYVQELPAGVFVSPEAFDTDDLRDRAVRSLREYDAAANTYDEYGSLI